MLNYTKILRILLFLIFSAPTLHAQIQVKKPKFTDIKVSGYIRNYVTYRNMQENYLTGGPLTPKTLMLNGLSRDINGQFTGYREPLLFLLLSGKPSVNTSFDIDFLLDNQMTGQIFNDKFDIPANPHGLNGNPNSGGVTIPRRVQSFRWLNLGGSITTNYGNFDLKVGGVLFCSMSPSTLWNYEYRDDMFERYPWEWQTFSMKRYQAFFNDQNLARDSRWGNAAIQGISLTASQLPYRTGFKLIYGKTNSSGGFQSFLNNNNQDMIAAQISKKMASHEVSANFYQSKVLINPASYDKTFRNVTHENILTSEVKLKFDKLSIYAETGAGSVANPQDSLSPWTPMINAKASLTTKVLPINLQYYYIGPTVVNLNSGILNTSNRNIQAQFGALPIYNINIFEGAITEFGQLSNNRQGINVSTAKTLGNFKVLLYLSSQQEIENKFNVITVQHRLNGFNRSQFEYYRNGIGPYGRQMNAWRRSWEKVSLTDTLSEYKKAFNLIDLAFKYKIMVFQRELILSNYINYNSVQNKLAPLALFTDKAYVRNLYQEFMFFYPVVPKLTLVGSLGLERVWANNKTALASNGKPMDQTGHGYGLGLDWDISSNAGLYFRQKWFSFSDKNFTLDHFKGFDTTVELKLFF